MAGGPYRHVADPLKAFEGPTPAARVPTGPTRRERALAEIEKGTTLAYDVAADYGQHFDNCKHMCWFQDAVEKELEATDAAASP